MNEKRKQEIIDTLSSKKLVIRCPMCNNNKFTLVDGYINHAIQDDYKKIVLGNGKMLPTVCLVCNNCGFVSQHSVGVLGLFNEDGNK